MQIRYPLSKHLAEVGSLVQKSRILVWAVISTALCAYLYCPAAEFLPAHVVDLMVVFTSAAKTGAGGESTIRSQIDLALVEANSVLQLSRVNMRLRLT